MTVLTGEFYRLTPINEHSPKYDLELLHEIGGKKPRQEFKPAGYGFTLESAIKHIIQYSVNRKLGEEATLKQFLNAYKEESDKIRRDLK